MKQGGVLAYAVSFSVHGGSFDIDDKINGSTLAYQKLKTPQQPRTLFVERPRCYTSSIGSNGLTGDSAIHPPLTKCLNGQVPLALQCIPSRADRTLSTCNDISNRLLGKKLFGNLRCSAGTMRVVETRSTTYAWHAELKQRTQSSDERANSR